jgi:hypothetical protein
MMIYLAEQSEANLVSSNTHAGTSWVSAVPAGRKHAASEYSTLQLL